jgi:hypothetical protein
VVNIQNPSDRPFTVLEVRVNATLARRRRRINPTSSSSSSSRITQPRVDRTSQNSDMVSSVATRGLRRMLRLLQQTGIAPGSGSNSSTAAAAAAAARERAAVANGPNAVQQFPGSDSTGELFNVMMGRAGGPPSDRPSTTSSSSSGRSSGLNPPLLPAPARPATRAPSGPSVSATVECPGMDKAGGIALPASNRRVGGSNPSSVKCKFTVVMPAQATLQATGRIQVVVLAAPAAGEGSSSNRAGSSSSSSSNAAGRVRAETNFNLKDR